MYQVLRFYHRVHIIFATQLYYIYYPKLERGMQLITSVDSFEFASPNAFKFFPHTVNTSQQTMADLMIVYSSLAPTHSMWLHIWLSVLYVWIHLSHRSNTYLKRVSFALAWWLDSNLSKNNVSQKKVTPHKKQQYLKCSHFFTVQKLNAKKNYCLHLIF